MSSPRDAGRFIHNTILDEHPLPAASVLNPLRLIQDAESVERDGESYIVAIEGGRATVAIDDGYVTRVHVQVDSGDTPIDDLYELSGFGEPTTLIEAPEDHLIDEIGAAPGCDTSATTANDLELCVSQPGDPAPPG